MKKLFNLLALLSVFVFLSCAQMINSETSVRVKLPGSNDGETRSVAVSYDVSDVASYQIKFLMEGDTEPLVYNCLPGKDLYIEDISVGVYEVVGYAKDADGECIGYGVALAEVLPNQANEVELVIKKNIVSSILAVLPQKQIESIGVVEDEVIDEDVLIDDIILQAAFKSGYTETLTLRELIDTGFFFVDTYYKSTEYNKYYSDVYDGMATDFVLSVYSFNCSVDEIIEIIESEKDLSSLEDKVFEVFNTSYPLTNNTIKLQMYDDQNTVYSKTKKFDKAKEIVLEEPQSRNGFSFAGWYYYKNSDDTNPELIINNVITPNELTKYKDGFFRGKWEVSDFSKISFADFDYTKYPYGITFNLNSSFGENLSTDVSSLAAFLEMTKYIPNMPAVAIKVSVENPYLKLADDGISIVSKADGKVIINSSGEVEYNGGEEIITPEKTLFTMKYYSDEYTNISGYINYETEGSSIELQSPVKDGFIFTGWYYYESDNENGSGPLYVIPTAYITNYTKENSYFRAHWKVSDITKINPIDYSVTNYPEGVIFTLDESFGKTSIESDIIKLNTLFSSFASIVGTANVKIKITVENSYVKVSEDGCKLVDYNDETKVYYDLENHSSNKVSIKFYIDDQTANYEIKEFDYINEYSLNDPQSRDGFEWKGWYYFDGTTYSTESTALIRPETLKNYTKENGKFIGRWELRDYASIKASDYLSSDYPDGYKLYLDNNFGANVGSDMTTLAGLILSFKDNPNSTELIIYITEGNPYLKITDDRKYIVDAATGTIQYYDLETNELTNSVIFNVYEDIYITEYATMEVSKFNTTNLTPSDMIQTRGGYSFSKWVFITNDEEKIELGFEITPEQVETLKQRGGRICGEWTLNDLSYVHPSDYPLSKYPNGFTVTLGDDFGNADNLKTDIETLASLAGRFKESLDSATLSFELSATNSNVKISEDGKYITNYNGTINCFNLENNKIVTKTIKFYDDDTSSKYQELSVNNFDTTLTLPDPSVSGSSILITRNGFTFLGWYKYDEAYSMLDTSNSVTTVDLTTFDTENYSFKAKWNITNPAELTINDFNKNNYSDNLLNLVLADTIGESDISTIGNFIYSLTYGNITDPGIHVKLDMSACTSISTIQGMTNSLKNLDGVILPPNLTTIGDASFRFDNISSITIPASVSSISGDALQNENYALTISLDSNEYFKTIENNNILVSTDEKVLIADGRKYTNNSVFKFEIPNGIEVIGPRVYKEIKSKFSIPDSVKEIKEYAFYYSGSGMTSITIPATVNKIMKNAFCTDHGSYVTFEDPYLWYKVSDEDSYNDMIDGELVDNINTSYDPSCYYYKKATVCTTVEELVSQINGLSTSGTYDFALKVTNLAEDGLSGVVEKIQHLDVGINIALDLAPSTAENNSMPKMEFSDIENHLIALYLPKTITKIDRAVGNCSGLTKVVIPSTVTTISGGFYGNMNTHTQFVIDGESSYFMVSEDGTKILSKDGKTLYVDGKQNVSLTEVTIPGYITTLAEFVYYNSPVSYITIPQNVTSIVENAFKGFVGEIVLENDKYWTVNNIFETDDIKSKLKSGYAASKNIVHVTGGLENLLSAIQNVTEDTYIRYDEELELLANNIKEGDTAGTLYSAVASAAKNLVLDLSKCSVTTIPESAFEDCSNLFGIYLPSGVEEIGNFAFAGTGLTEITIPASVTEIGASVKEGLGTENITFEAPNDWQYCENTVWKNCSSLLDLQSQFSLGRPLQKKNE